MINSGVANAATGEQGELDALATAAETARLLDLDAGGGARPLDRRDRRAAAAARSCSPASRRGRALSPDGGADAAEAILTTDTRTKEAVVARDGFTVGGMAKGSGMIHPQPRDDARRRHDRLPARAGRGARLPPARGRARASTGSRSTASARRTTPSSCSRTARAASSGRRATDASFAAALGEVCAELAAADRRRRRGRDRARRDRGHRRRDAPARRTRSRAGSPPRRSSRPRAFGHDANWGRVLAAAGSAPCNGGFAQVDVDRLDAALQRRRRVLRRGAPPGVEPDARGRRLPDRARPRPRRRRSAATSPPTSPTTTSASTRSTDVSRVVVKVGGAVAATPRRSCSSSRPRHEVVRRPRRRPADLGRDGARAGSSVAFVGGRRVTTPAALAVVREALARRQRGSSARRSARAPSASSATRSACGATPVPELGLVGDPLPSRPAGGRSTRSPPGSIPVVAPLAAGPLNVNADEAAAALAVGLGAERILFVTDVPGVLRRRRRRRRDRGRRGRPAARRRRASRAGSSRSCAPRCAPRGSASAPRSARRRWSRERRDARPRVLPTYAARGRHVRRGRRRLADRRRRPPLPRLRRRDRRRRRSATATRRRSPPRTRSSTGSGTSRTSTGPSRWRSSPSCSPSASAARRRSSATPAPRRSRRRSSTRARRPASPGIVALEGSFHGRTHGALAVTGQPAKRAAFEPLAARRHASRG